MLPMHTSGLVSYLVEVQHDKTRLVIYLCGKQIISSYNEYHINCICMITGFHLIWTKINETFLYDELRPNKKISVFRVSV